jgi:hypothetical protein
MATVRRWWGVDGGGTFSGGSLCIYRRNRDVSPVRSGKRWNGSESIQPPGTPKDIVVAVLSSEVDR